MITRYNGTDKIADVTLTKSDVPSVPDGPRLVVDNITGQMPSLGPGVYDFFLRGRIADGTSGGVVTHSGLNNTTTRFFNRIEAYVGGDWQEIGKAESVMPNSTLPAGTLQLWRNDQSTAVDRLIVNKISG